METTHKKSMALTNKIPVDNKECLKNVEMNSIDSQVTGMKSFQNFSILEMGKFFKECIQPRPSFTTNYQSVAIIYLNGGSDWICIKIQKHMHRLGMSIL